MVKEIVLVQRYTSNPKTPEEIKAFNDFYDLEEERLNQESEMQKEWNNTDEGREWCITVFMENNF